MLQGNPGRYPATYLSGLQACNLCEMSFECRCEAQLPWKLDDVHLRTLSGALQLLRPCFLRLLKFQQP